MATPLSLDHSGLGVLSREECLRRIRTARVGRVAFVENGEPVILPVNHGLDGDAVVFRTAPGSKLTAAENDEPVAFEVDAFDVDRLRCGSPRGLERRHPWGCVGGRRSGRSSAAGDVRCHAVGRSCRAHELGTDQGLLVDRPGSRPPREVEIRSFCQRRPDHTWQIVVAGQRQARLLSCVAAESLTV